MSALELDHIRAMPCDLRDERPEECAWGTDAHHETGAGMALKANDRRTIPLCHRHHMDFHDHRGYFWNWTKEERRQWQDDRIAHYWPDDVDGAEIPF